MTSLIDQLQSAALDRATSVSDLIRMAMVVARKLAVPEIQEWITHELYGYRGDVPVPEYRKLRGELNANNPYRGWMPVQFENADVQVSYSSGIIGDPISAVETMVRGSQVVGFKLPAEIDVKVRKAMNYNVPVLLHIQSANVATILDTVRNKILDWALKLEEAGVMGDGMSFSQRDQVRAHTINIAGNVGVIGDLTGPANVAATSGLVNQFIDAAAVLQAVEAVRSHLPSVPENKRSEAEQQLNELDAEARLQKPDQSKLRSGLQTLGKVAGQIRDKVVEAGVKALVDNTLGG